MFEIFERYIKQTNKVSDQDLDILNGRCVEKKVRKGQYLLNEGEVWSLLCFIASGCFSIFQTDKERIDHTFSVRDRKLVGNRDDKLQSRKTI